MRRFFPERLCEFRNCFIACYLISSFMIGYYAHKSYKTFFAEKKFMMEIASYKIASDLVNIFDHAESALNDINKKIVTSNRSNAALSDIMIEAGKSYDKNLLKFELSTGKYYWIDAANRLIANSEAGLIKNPIDLSNRDYLQNTATDPRKICVGEPIVGASSGQYVMPMGVGAQDASGRYVGTMAVSFKLSDLAVRYKEISDSYKVNFALLSANNANSYVVLRASDKYQYKILAGYQNKVLLQELSTKMACCLLQFLIVTMFFVVAMFYLRKECSL